VLSVRKKKSRVIRVARRLDADDNKTYIIIDIRKARKLLKTGMWMIKLYKVTDDYIKKLTELQSDKYVIIS
jgi:hypothetical protein